MTLCATDIKLRVGARQILDGVDCHVYPGQLTALVGPNGAGKTSLLRVCSGELEPSKGAVSYGSHRLRHLDLQQRAAIRSVMQQSSAVVFDFSVDEVLAMGWVQGDSLGREHYQTARAWVVGTCRLGPLLQRRFNALSGGEQQRVQFARALLQIWRPQGVHTDRYLLLDEPTSNLDIAHQLTLLSLVREVLKQQVGALVVLHDLNVAARFADHVVLLKDGAVVDSGAVERVMCATQLSSVYGADISVSYHQALERLVVSW